MFKSVLARLNLRWFWEYLTPDFRKDFWQQQIFPQHRWLLTKIKALKPRSIFEPGCGFGRNLSYLIKQGIKPSILTGADFAFQPPDSIKFVRANVLKLPFPADNFDLVFTHGLLMHLKPQNLVKAMSELIRVSKKYLILIEEVRSRPGQLNYFTWAHDYEKLIRQFKLKVLESHLDKQLKLKCLLIQK
ncbi:MAG: class I SAM-dependent methyltransferase [Patescibacteria group bacterium]